MNHLHKFAHFSPNAGGHLLIIIAIIVLAFIVFNGYMFIIERGGY
jgi:hypothetical protein